MLNYRQMRLDFAKYPRQACGVIVEAIRNKEIKPEEFSLRQLAESVVPDGIEWVRSLDPNVGGGYRMLEAGDGVDVTAFANITGQIVYSKIMDAYLSPAFVCTSLVDTIATRLDGEKIPGIGKVSDGTFTVDPGMPYPSVGFGEDYIETPSTTKSGLIIPVTKEAIFFDRTQLVLSRAGEVGEVLGLNKEKRLADLIVGTTNNYKWKGTTYDTYSTDGSTGAAGGTALSGVINALASNDLVDWTDVDAAEQLFANILDPNTGEPVLVTANSILVMPARSQAMKRVLSATEIRYTATSAETETISTNPIAGRYTSYVSAIAYRRLIAASVSAADAAKYWFIGDFKKAFAYMENWPITVVQAPMNSEAEFEQDIVARFKASERGAAAVMNPRFVVRCTG